MTGHAQSRPEPLRILGDAQRALVDDALTREQALAKALACALELTGREGACIELLEESEAIVEAASGLLTPLQGTRTRAELLHDFGLRMLEPAVPVSNRLAAEEARRWSGLGVTALTALPLSMGARTLGRLVLASRAPVELTDESLCVVELLAGVIAGRLERDALSRLHAAREQESAAAIEYMRTSDALFWTAFESSGTAMLLINTDGRLVQFNGAVSDMFGYSADALATMNLFDFYPPEHVETGRENLNRLLAREMAVLTVERRFRRADQTWVWGELSAAVIHDPHGCPLYLFVQVQDITTRKRAAEELSRQAELLRERAELIELMDDAVMVHDFQERILFWNRGAEKLFGWRREEAIGQTMKELLRTEYPESHEAVVEQLECEGRWSGELIHRRRDGSPIAVHSRSAVHLDRVGAPSAILVVSTDVSEKKRLEARLRVTERLATVGSLAAGVAHEINNPLAYVVANLSAIARDLQDLRPQLGERYEDLAEACSEARDGAERVRNIVRDLQNLARDRAGAQAPVELQKVVEQALRLASNELQHRARVVTDFAPVGPVFGGEGRLGQVVLNLLVNAAHAIPAGARDANEVRVSLRQEGERAVIEIRDTGTGISPEHLQRIFDPFFTTKPIGSGMGLGLSLVHSIVREHGGEVSATSQPGGPTVFRVELPIANAEQAEEPHAEPVQPVSSLATKPNVLVVDDEPLVARSVERMLSGHARVVSVQSGAEALERLSRESFDVVLCDLMMPQMTGIEFDAELARVPEHSRPRLLMMTGGAFTPETRSYLEQTQRTLLRKPFEQGELLAALSRTIGSGGGAQGAH